MWSLADAQRYLRSLEVFGMRFGLDRMRRLSTALGLPQESFESVHVVGSNGKSSTARMLAAILQGHGVRTGSYLSPHLVSFCERIRIGDRDVSEARFAAAVARAAHAAQLVDRTLGPGDRVTQFEALTAAAYSELAREGVQAAVIEAGLGGRYDATNVIDSRVTVLTNVGLEHTRWLGPTISDIAGEKLDVLRPGAVLVLGADLHPEAEAVAQDLVRERGAHIVRAPADPADLLCGDAALLARGPFQRRNFALAATAARAFLAVLRPGAGQLDPSAVAQAAAATAVPGRFQLLERSPLTVLDGAHNPAGMQALLEALDELAPARRLPAVVSILEDKDAAGMLSRLIPHCRELVLTRAANPRALPPATLASLARQLGGPPTRLEADPQRALRVARELAGPDGVVLATGSIYLIADLLRGPGGVA